ncbi:MAG TPA: AAA family ATPase, partial [Xanthomonadales bacterium]|nr:AAA family ATPase [Xanthomonadales bacterium]
EKAHQDVFNILLQILDDGRLTDSQGRTVDFRNTVIIMTSNIGSQYILEHANADWALVETQVTQAMRSHFKPEFLNRVDETIVFHQLGREHFHRIVDIQLEHLEARLRDREIGLEVDDAALDRLGESGFDPVYGARPLKRAIQSQIENPLAQRILAGEFRAGDTIRVHVDGGRLAFAKAQRAAA